MQISPVFFSLKDGRQAELRSPTPADAEELIAYLQTTAEETTFLLRTPEEWAGLTVQREREILERVRMSPDEVMIVCTVEGTIAGNCSLSFLTPQKFRHRATVGIALLQRYWDLGIGTRMFREMIRLAEEREETRQMELEFAEGNFRGQALYEKMGFRLAAVHPNAIREPDGTFRSLCLMIRLLRQ